MPTSPPGRRRIPGMGRLGWRILVAFLAVTFVPMVVMGSAAWVQARGVIEEYLAQDTEQKVRLWAADLDAFLAQQRSILDALSLGNDSSETVGMLNKAVAQTPSIEALVLMDVDGSLIASSPRPEKIGPWVRQACARLIAEPARVMTHGGDEHTHQVLIATVPESTNGALCALVSFTLHQDMLAERARSVAGATPYIVDRNGDVVCHAYEEAEHHVGRGQFLGGLPASVAERGVIWSGRIRNEHGVRYAAYAPAKTLPWGIWVEIPDDVATASLQPLLHRAGLCAIAFGGVVTIFAFLASRSLVGPLNRVAAAAQDMAGGRPGQTVPIQGADEVADLARQFNRMSLALADSYEELDDRVARRTRELAAARDFSDQLIDAMHERILVLSPTGAVVRANNAAQAAWGDDIVGISWDALIPRLGVEPDQMLRLSETVLDEGRPCSMEWVCAHPSQGQATAQDEVFEVQSYPVPGTDGTFSAVIWLIREVTEMRRMQARLVHQEKLASLGMLSAGLAHEIGNPLASMSSELELLELCWDPDQARDSVPVLREQVRRMSELLRELADFGRRSRERQDDIEAGDIVKHALRLLKHDKRARGVEMNVDLGEELPRIRVSQDRIIQVLVNLGINALDALGGQGKLSFSTRTSGSEAVAIEVCDDGPGMTEDVARHVFDPFYTTKAPGVGTGLGLFVSEQIVRGQGGQVELHTQPGSGTRIVVILPAAPAALGHGTGGEA